MNFMQLLNSLDDLLYGVVSWLVFFPVTLWRTIRHPLRMMEYAARELERAEKEQFLDTISPPLFLLIAVLLSHMVELTLIGDSPIVGSRIGLAGLVNDDTSLVIMRLFVFSVFPLMMATRLVRKQGVGINRKTLKLPFYSQCLVTAPFALLIGLSSTAVQIHGAISGSGALILLALALGWYLVVETWWFSTELEISRARGFFHALLATVESLLVMFLALPLLF